MAISQKFIEQVTALNTRGEKFAIALHHLSLDALKSAYSNADLEKMKYLMGNIPKYAQTAAYKWFKRMGINIAAPEVGQTTYLITGVLDNKQQAKVFERATATPVLVSEITAKAEPKKRELKGTPQTRAADAVSKLITRLQDSDYETAALINDRWTSNSHKSVLFNADGNAIYLDATELELVVDLLLKRELALRHAA